MIHHGAAVVKGAKNALVVVPELKIYQCGLPKEMAIELFKPFVMKELVERKLSQFGAEPKDYEVLAFLMERHGELRFSPPVDVSVKEVKNL
ncbi:DUF2992 family protein, partial [Anaerostipes caccae]